MTLERRILNLMDEVDRLKQERNGLKAAYELEQREANEFSQELAELQATVDRLTAALRDIHEKAQTFNDAWVMAEAALTPADKEAK